MYVYDEAFCFNVSTLNFKRASISTQSNPYYHWNPWINAENKHDKCLILIINYFSMNIFLFVLILLFNEYFSVLQKRRLINAHENRVRAQFLPGFLHVLDLYSNKQCKSTIKFSYSNAYFLPKKCSTGYLDGLIYRHTHIYWIHGY